MKVNENDGRKNDRCVRIYESMLQSSAFKNLSKNQRMLYICMKAQYGKREPGKDFPEIESLQKDEMFYFTMNMAEEYNLYSKSNDAQFYKDVKALIDYGFIRKERDGRKAHGKSIFEFTDSWK